MVFVINQSKDCNIFQFFLKNILKNVELVKGGG